MRIEHQPYNYDLYKRFSQLREVHRRGIEDAVLYCAEQDGKFYTIFDQSFLMEFVNVATDETLRQKLIEIYEFENEIDRQAHLDEFIRKLSPQ